jgi:hypothetical protein
MVISSVAVLAAGTVYAAKPPPKTPTLSKKLCETALADGGLGGTWTAGKSKLCTITVTTSVTFSFTIPKGADLEISDEVTLTISSGVDNYGRIDVYESGTIINNNDLSNYGVIVNGGSITNSHVLTNDGSIDNSGTITNNAVGTITNAGSISNNDGGTITNAGSISNYATIGNGGTINNNSGGIINNNSGGIITSDGIINNLSGGTINNNAGSNIENWGTVSNSGTWNGSCTDLGDGSGCPT